MSAPDDHLPEPEKKPATTSARLRMRAMATPPGSGAEGAASRDPGASPAAPKLIRPDSDSIPHLSRMMSKTRRISLWADRIRLTYFSDPAKQMPVRKGERILVQDETNDRLYYVLKGSFSCTITLESDLGTPERLFLYRSLPGGFVGVRSYFSDTGLAVFDATADEDSLVAWIDHTVEAVDVDRFGSFREQFFPVIMQELERRQFRLTRAEKERVSANIRLHKAEDMATLGQFAAGLAHELNNATSVLMSSSQHLGSKLGEYFRKFAPDLSNWFARGMEPEAELSSAEVRAKARELSQKQKVEYETAKDLVRMYGGDIQGKLPKDTASLRDAWMTGRSCRDIMFASKHAANIIHSIKQLSTGGHAVREPMDIADSLAGAVELLRDTLKEVEVQPDIQPGLPLINGNIGEFMQIWLNIMKNAAEAMRDAGTRDPRINLSARHHAGEITVSIADNGPGIPLAVRDTLFQPSITTKAGSRNSMGLGLGLYIVKRLVETYHGRIEVKTDNNGSAFSVFLPLDPDAAARSSFGSGGLSLEEA